MKPTTRRYFVFSSLPGSSPIECQVHALATWLFYALVQPSPATWTSTLSHKAYSHMARHSFDCKADQMARHCVRVLTCQNEFVALYNHLASFFSQIARLSLTRMRMPCCDAWMCVPTFMYESLLISESTNDHVSSLHFTQFFNTDLKRSFYSDFERSSAFVVFPLCGRSACGKHLHAS